MAFSSGLTLADLSDYLAPSQLCIKPVTMVEDLSDPTPAEVTPKDPTAPVTEIVIDQEHGYYEVGEKGTRGKKLKKAEITLNDCLACSGCVTSAESVLVAMQSHEEVYRVLEERPDLTPILSIAPQSLASLAALHSLSLPETLRGLRIFFKKELGFRLVFDTTFARSISLSENRLEFLERRSNASGIPDASALAKSTLSPESSTTGPLPILSSACPGWVCYAEKTHGELLPFVSNVKSSQAVMGTLVKGVVAKETNLQSDQIYHVTVMPCYDKKLEASRPDFASPFVLEPHSTIPTIRDVDCVLTTGEVQKMLDDKNISLPFLALQSPRVIEDEDHFFPSLLTAPGSSSGGYLHNAIQAILETLPVEDLYRTRLEEKKVRSEDYIEYTLIRSPVTSTSSPPPSTLVSLSLSPPTATSSRDVLLRAAKCYGFRNLQNIVRKIGRDAGISVLRGAAGKSSSAAASAATARRNAAIRRGKGKAELEGGEEDKPFDFVEVMACPSGCVNGGGQIAPPKTPVGRGRKRQKVVMGLNGFMGEKVDDEGMPDVAETMPEDGEEEVKMVADLDIDERVLSGKEWVALVEETYWESGTTLELNQKRMGIDWSRIDESIRPFLEGEEGEVIERLKQRTLDQLLVGAGERGQDREEMRRNLLRTSYRAVEVEEMNGLAVKW